MKLKLLAVACATLASIASAPVHAGALAASDLNISQLFLADPITGAALGANASIQILSESRTGTAASNYNSVVGGGVGPGSLSTFTIGAPIDVGYRCAGPDCATVGALYGGAPENNTSTHLTTPPTKNFALGDMLISGSAIGGVISGLTRADASATGPNNSGGSNATILNSASLRSNFTVGSTFDAKVAVTADSFLKVWVSTTGNEAAQASAGQGWILTIGCSTNCGATWSDLIFVPSQLNKSRTSTSADQNLELSFGSATLLSDVRTYTAGTEYTLTINQSSNATVSSVPEPSSIALLGAALLGMAGVTTRRRRQA